MQSRSLGTLWNLAGGWNVVPFQKIVVTIFCTNSETVIAVRKYHHQVLTLRSLFSRKHQINTSNKCNISCCQLPILNHTCENTNGHNVNTYKNKVLLTLSKWMLLVLYHRHYNHFGQNTFHAISQQQSPAFIYNIKVVYITSVIQGLRSGYGVYTCKTQPMLYISILSEHCYSKVGFCWGFFYLLRSQTFGSVNAVDTENTTEPVCGHIMQLTGMGRRKNQKQI